MIHYIHGLLAQANVNVSVEAVAAIVELLILLVLAAIVGAVLRLVLKTIFTKLQTKAGEKRFTYYVLTPIFARRLSGVAIPIAFSAGLNYAPISYAGGYLARICALLASLILLYNCTRAIFVFLDGIVNFQEQRIKHGLNSLPIKSYLQLIKILLACVALILAVAMIFDKSPLALLTGLGALSAVLMLVFKDTIVAFVTSLQLPGMVKLGDWIEMPSQGANGEIVDISLYYVKVQNWDNTFTFVPSVKLVTDSFINWRGMQDSGGRRIKRSLFLDLTKVRHLSARELRQLQKIQFLHDYVQDILANKEAYALLDETTGLVEDFAPGKEGVTNLKLFQYYTLAYLRHHRQIRQDMTLMTRLLEATSDGVPLEIYCFTNTVVWTEYEAIQDKIFAHFFAVAPAFYLRAFQKISVGEAKNIAAVIVPTANE